MKRISIFQPNWGSSRSEDENKHPLRLTRDLDFSHIVHHPSVVSAMILSAIRHVLMEAGKGTLAHGIRAVHRDREILIIEVVSPLIGQEISLLFPQIRSELARRFEHEKERWESVTIHTR